MEIEIGTNLAVVLCVVCLTCGWVCGEMFQKWNKNE